MMSCAPPSGLVGLIRKRRESSCALKHFLSTSWSSKKKQSGEAYELVVRDSKSGFVFFNIEGHHYDYDLGAATR